MLLAIVFLTISVAAITLARGPVPAGPWKGLYTSFPLFWVFLAIAVVVLVRTSVLSGVRLVPLVVLAAIFASALVMAPTLKWGVPYGIRDPWIHLASIKSIHLIGNPYPFLHVLVATAAEITQLPHRWILSRTQIFAAMVGVVWVFATVSQINDSSWLLTGLALFPIVYMWGNSRPFSVGPVFIILVWWVLLRYNLTSTKIVGFIVIPATFWWHPVGAFIAILILCMFIAVHMVVWLFPQIKTHLVDVDASRESLYVLTAFGGVLIVFYLLDYTGIFEATVVTGLFSEGSASVERSSVIRELPSQLFQAFRMGIFVIVLTTVSVISAIYRLNKRVLSTVHIVSVLAVVPLAIVFVTIDLLSIPGFGARRLLRLVPLVLLPGVAFAFQDLANQSSDRGTKSGDQGNGNLLDQYINWSRICRTSRLGISPLNRRVLRVGLALLVLTSGLAIVHDSPFKGGSETGSTTSDVRGVNWLQTHKTDNPVIGSENTLFIVKGLYGEQTVRNWSNNDPYYYQTIRRNPRYSWEVEVREPGTYIVVNKQAQIRANDSTVVNQFNRKTVRIYDNGNVWMHRSIFNQV